MTLINGEAKNFRTKVREDYEAVRGLAEGLGGEVELNGRDLTALLCIPLDISLGGLMNALTYGVEQGGLAYRTAPGADPTITLVTGVYYRDPTGQPAQ